MDHNHHGSSAIVVVAINITETEDSVAELFRTIISTG